MKWMLRMAFSAVLFTTGLRGQAPGAPEPLSAWQYVKEIPMPGGASGLLDFVLDRDALDKARIDEADLRLYDAGGREIPYALRVRREAEMRNPLPAREFDRSREGGVAQVSFDLGEEPQQHNEVEVETPGSNFRRLADIQGSADGRQWSTLAAGKPLFRFTATARTVEQKAVTYPVSRYRYLRVRVSRDPQTDAGAPEIQSVRIRRLVQVPGEMLPFAAATEARAADRANSRPASIWRLDLSGRIPLQRLTLMVTDGPFSRPFRVEAVDDPATPLLLASGQLTRTGGATAPAAIEFPEHFARRLKLTVTDDRNAPLALTGVTAWSAAREVVFEAGSVGAGPLRLYYGNPKALAPHYDVAALLPVDLRPGPVRLALGAQRDNPVYRPEPKPLSERSPWLVYVVLAAAAVVLAAILISLARASARGAPAS